MLLGIHFWMSKKPIERATDSLHDGPFWERERCIWGLIDNLARGQDNLVDGCNSSFSLLVVWIINTTDKMVNIHAFIVCRRRKMHVYS